MQSKSNYWHSVRKQMEDGKVLPLGDEMIINN